MFKALAGVEAEQFHLRETLQDVHQGVDSGLEAFSGQHRDIGGLDEEQHDFFSVRSDEAVLGDGLDVHEPAGRLISFSFSELVLLSYFESPPVC